MPSEFELDSYQTALTPEDREAFEKNPENFQEGKLPGAPGSAEQSALLAIPQLGKVSMDVVRMENKPKAETDELKKWRIENLRSQKALIKEWLRDPNRLPAYFNALHILAESESLPKNRQTNAKALEEEIKNNLEALLEGAELPEVGAFGKLLQLAAKDALYSEIAKRIIKFFFQNAKSTKAVLEFFNNLATAVMREPDRETFLYGLRTVMMESDATPADKEKIKLCIRGYMGGDKILQMTLDLDAVASGVIAHKHLPEEVDRSKKLWAEVGAETSIKNAWLEYDRKNPIKSAELDKALESMGKKIFTVEEGQQKKWPFNLVLTNPSPLRLAYNARLGQEDDAKFRNFKLPGEALPRLQHAENPEKFAESLLHRLQNLKETLTVGQATDMEFIFYCAPNLSREQKVGLAELNANFQHEIITSRIHGISPRGDKLIIAEPSLKKVGFESVTFEIVQPHPRIKASLQVGKCRCEFALDADLVPKPYSGEELWQVSFEQRAFIEFLLLSHLKELQCTERVEASGTGGVKVTEQTLQRQKEFTSRRSHLTPLPAGKRFTERARLLALADPNRWDLVEINRIERRTAETGLKTYTSPVESVKLTDKGPLISRAPHALDRLNEILKKSL